MHLGVEKRLPCCTRNNSCFRIEPFISPLKIEKRYFFAAALERERAKESDDREGEESSMMIGLIDWSGPRSSGHPSRPFSASVRMIAAAAESETHGGGEMDTVKHT